MTSDVDHGIVIPTGHFSPSAKTQAKAPGAKQVELVDGERLCELLDEHGLGVTKIERRKVDREWLEKVQEGRWGIAIGPPRQDSTCTRRLVDPVKVGTVGGEHSHLALRRDVDALRAIRHVGHCLPDPGHFIGDLADLPTRHSRNQTPVGGKIFVVLSRISSVTE